MDFYGFEGRFNHLPGERFGLFENQIDPNSPEGQARIRAAMESEDGQIGAAVAEARMKARQGRGETGDPSSSEPAGNGKTSDQFVLGHLDEKAKNLAKQVDKILGLKFYNRLTRYRNNAERYLPTPGVHTAPEVYQRAMEVLDAYARRYPKSKDEVIQAKKDLSKAYQLIFAADADKSGSIAGNVDASKDEWNNIPDDQEVLVRNYSIFAQAIEEFFGKKDETKGDDKNKPGAGLDEKEKEKASLQAQLDALMPYLRQPDTEYLKSAENKPLAERVGYAKARVQEYAKELGIMEQITEAFTSPVNLILMFGTGMVGKLWARAKNGLKGRAPAGSDPTITPSGSGSPPAGRAVPRRLARRPGRAARAARRAQAQRAAQSPATPSPAPGAGAAPSGVTPGPATAAAASPATPVPPAGSPAGPNSPLPSPATTAAPDAGVSPTAGSPAVASRGAPTGPGDPIELPDLGSSPSARGAGGGTPSPTGGSGGGGGGITNGGRAVGRFVTGPAGVAIAMIALSRAGHEAIDKGIKDPFWNKEAHLALDLLLTSGYIEYLVKAWNSVNPGVPFPWAKIAKCAAAYWGYRNAIDDVDRALFGGVADSLLFDLGEDFAVLFLVVLGSAKVIAFGTGLLAGQAINAAANYYAGNDYSWGEFVAGGGYWAWDNYYREFQDERFSGAYRRDRTGGLYDRKGNLLYLKEDEKGKATLVRAGDGGTSHLVDVHGNKTHENWFTRFFVDERSFKAQDQSYTEKLHKERMKLYGDWKKEYEKKPDDKIKVLMRKTKAGGYEFVKQGQYVVAKDGKTIMKPQKKPDGGVRYIKAEADVVQLEMSLEERYCRAVKAYADTVNATIERLKKQGEPTEVWKSVKEDLDRLVGSQGEDLTTRVAAFDAIRSVPMPAAPISLTAAVAKPASTDGWGSRGRDSTPRARDSQKALVGDD